MRVSEGEESETASVFAGSGRLGRWYPREWKRRELSIWNIKILKKYMLGREEEVLGTE